MWPSPAHCSRNANIGVLCRRGNGRTAGCVGNNSRLRVAGRYSPAGDSNRSRAVSLYLREISISCPPTLTREGWYSPTLLASKGETLKDTIMMVSNYVDLIIMRHYLDGAARYASEVSSIPIINAGDGANQHPSQTMLDLYSIYKTQGTLENLNITMVGDLKYGRTVHSLLMAMSHFKPTFHFVAPEELKMPEEYKIYCDKLGIPYQEHQDFTEEVINQADILYMTRVQRERFTDLMEYEKVKNVYTLHNQMLENSKPNLRILHPLPRVNEIAYDVDDNPKAYYFEQAKNGLYARQAIICKVLGIEI